MPGKFSFASLCLLALLRHTYAQEVVIAREERPHFPRAEVVVHSQSTNTIQVEKPMVAQSVKRPALERKATPGASLTMHVPKDEQSPAQPPKAAVPIDQTRKVATPSTPSKPPVVAAKPVLSLGKGPASSFPPSKSEANRAELETSSANVPRPTRLTVVPGPASENHSLPSVSVPPVNHFDTAFSKLANGFDFPVGKPDAQGYYKARGFRSRGHLGEDWDGIRGGDTDFNDPIYSIGDGMVVFARDCHMGWGNVMIIRHSYREGGGVKNIDALYGHLNQMLVHRGQAVTRGQQIATMGTAHGLYDAHLHLEIRKNIEIGMSRTKFARDSSNYYDPTQFILAHRHLASDGGPYRVAMNTFVRDGNINWNKAKNYSHSRSRGGTSGSAAALKKAIASKR